ncbi:DUF1206 domain-containing protein, partial [Arthrobacter sp. GCM10027362]|uniref:DUF1206 domain-containing protein n=1 Tax=Arthrobacter sp. GCM10027362 TaxID=3273379 RepID=UPI003643F015
MDNARDSAGDRAGEPGAGPARELAGAAQRAEQSRPFEIMARCGWAANGLLHLLIGVIALRLAFGRSGEADQSGAAAQLAG